MIAGVTCLCLHSMDAFKVMFELYDTERLPISTSGYSS
jgi:hypothetical protein